jgi:PIN domain nuclease of toxin-antitoxin system
VAEAKAQLSRILDEVLAGEVHDDALLGGSLSWEHRDPFDRVLAAQALRRGVPLVTRDRAVSAVTGLTTVW